MAIITDAWYIDTCIEEVGVRYGAHINQATDYSAFGAPLPGRNWYSKQYRQGFNGEEHENNLYADGMAYDLGARWYDARLGRMFSPDPLEAKYPWQSSYAYCGNSPIVMIDVDGMGGGDKAYGSVNKGEGLSQFAKRYGGKGGSLLSKMDAIAGANPDVFKGYASWSKGKTDKQKWDYFNDSKNYVLKPDQKLALPEGTKVSQYYRWDDNGHMADAGKYANGNLNAPITYEPQEVKSTAPKTPIQVESENSSRFSISQGNTGSGTNWAQGTLAFISADVLIPEPTDLAPPKWIAYGVAGTAAVVYLAFAGNGNENYPGPWTYTYRPPSQDPINNPPNGFDPKELPPGLGTGAKWIIAGRLLYELHDEYNQRMTQIGMQPYTTTTTKDKTYVQPKLFPYYKH